MGKEKKIPFPQINNIPLMLNVLIFIEIKDYNGLKTLGIVNRQIDYYMKALHFFEMIDSKKRITMKGIYVIKENNNNLQKQMLRNLIVVKPAFLEVEEYYRTFKILPDKNIIANYIKAYYNYQPATLYRRASSIISIFKYLNK